MTADTREKKPGKRARAAGAGQEPLVSVIVPVYNVCAYLEESLDSVLRQSHERLEILIVDDGSTDGSGEICERYAEKDPRIRVFRQNNRGLSAARNVGLDNASGEYIAFLDSDDAFHERMIQTLLDVLRLQKADIAVCGVSVHRTEGRMKPDEQGAARSRSRLADRDEALRICLDGGIDSAQHSFANRHRVRKGHPDGAFRGLGMSPCRGMRLLARAILGSGMGTAEMRDLV